MKKIVVALDSFKGSIAAASAVEAFSSGWHDHAPTASLVPRPMADGGEGTIAAFGQAVPGALPMRIRVRGPRSLPVDASWMLLADNTGVIELASTSGIELLGELRRPLDADTVGFGEAIAAALDHGVDRLIVGIGSSASTDGGMGMLSALGARFLDDRGFEVLPGARGLATITSVDLSALRQLPSKGVIVLSDVTNPLVGPTGAAQVFGPQKGLDSAAAASVDADLRRYAKIFDVDPLLPGAGAAGGTGFALMAWGARLTSGAEQVGELVQLEAAIAGADLVVTGEGSYDAQSGAGKVPFHVAGIAAAAKKPVVLVAGRVGADADLAPFHDVVSLTELAGSAEASLADPERWMRAAGRLVASRADRP